MEELLTVLSADFLDLSYQHNVLPPELPLAAVRDSIRNLNILIIVIISSNQFKVFDCDNCTTINFTIASPDFQSKQTPALPRLQNHQVVPIATQLIS